jgi:hypothetical protein
MNENRTYWENMKKAVKRVESKMTAWIQSHVYPSARIIQYIVMEAISNLFKIPIEKIPG